MKLIYSPASPYARAARCLLHIHNLYDQIQEKHLHPFDNPEELVAGNPLSKVPVLKLSTGEALYDSDVIIRFLDQQMGDGSVTEGLFCGKDSNWTLNTAMSLCRGLLDTCVSLQGEKLRDGMDNEASSPWFSNRFRAAIERALEQLSNNLGLFSTSSLKLTELMLFIALDYVQFRHPEFNVKDNYPALVEWQTHFNNHPALKATSPF